MMTGFNSNVEREGQVYHVQTEDKGLDDPIVETRVYCGGQVVASVRHSYADLADFPDYSQDRMARRMQEQHRSFIRALEMGRIEQLDIRPPAGVSTADPDNLVEEYVEDWIETSSWTAPVLRTLD